MIVEMKWYPYSSLLSPELPMNPDIREIRGIIYQMFPKSGTPLGRLSNSQIVGYVQGRSPAGSGRTGSSVLYMYRSVKQTKEFNIPTRVFPHFCSSKISTNHLTKSSQVLKTQAAIIVCHNYYSCHEEKNVYEMNALQDFIYEHRKDFERRYQVANGLKRLAKATTTPHLSNSLRLHRSVYH